MKLVENKDGSFIPAYDRTNITDDINKLLGQRTDTQIVPKARIRKILKDVKKG